MFSTFAAIMAWAVDRRLVATKPCARPGELYHSTRSESVWTTDDESALKAVAPPRIWLAYLLAVWTGQRQGDLLRLTWKAYDGTYIRLRQSKGGRRVVIPVGGPLKVALDKAAMDKKAVTILTTTKKTPWTSDGFRTTWGKVVAKAKTTGLTFHDLRGTALTRLALAEASEAEIAAITGHSLSDVGAILDAHYLSRDSRLADNAMKKREIHEGRTKIPN
jgi:integrase